MPDLEKLKAAAGFCQEVTFEDGIKKLIAYKKENGI